MFFHTHCIAIVTDRVVDAFSHHIESAVENAILKKLNEGITKIGSLLESLPAEVIVDETSALNVTFVSDPTLGNSSIGFMINGLFIPRNGALANQYQYPYHHQIAQASPLCSTPAKMIAMSLHEDVFNSASLVYFNVSLFSLKILFAFSSKSKLTNIFFRVLMIF